jgi:Domain of unknown function (DUF1932)
VTVGFIGFGERRAREMEEVAATLRAIGVEPIMAEATARRQDWSAGLNLRAHFGPEGPRTAAEVAAAVAHLTGQLAEQKLRGASGSDGWLERSTA